MNGKWIAVGVVAFLLLVVGASYNGLINAEEDVDGAWSEYSSQLKRRNDLIPNLVETVKGYARHEREVFEQVTEARAKVGQVVNNIDVSKLAGDPALQQQLAAASQGLTGALSRLIAVAEAYPDLKANQNFVRLQDELAGTENRTTVARGRAIEHTRDFNKKCRRFPSNVVANVFGFEAKEYYEATDAEQATPKVQF